MSHMDYLEEIARVDVTRLRKKEKLYGGSWKKRGGVGAFMMLARKWDRIENQAKHALHDADVRPPNPEYRDIDAYDIFGHIEAQGDRNDGLLEDVRDLRCYLLLVEAEMRARKEKEPEYDELGRS